MPTDWENRYQAGDTPWDKGGPHPVLGLLIEQGEVGGRILAPGSGLGYDVRELARAADEVLGLDVAPSAVSRALSYPAVGKETYLHGDFFDLPAEFKGSFDMVWEHTCFCAIDPALRPAYVEAAA